MKKTNQYALRLPVSIMAVLRQVATEEGISINQFIATAVAEKLAALQTVTWLKERAAKADFKKFDKLMSRLGHEPPQAGDELPKKLSKT